MLTHLTWDTLFFSGWRHAEVPGAVPCSSGPASTKHLIKFIDDGRSVSEQPSLAHSACRSRSTLRWVVRTVSLGLVWTGVCVACGVALALKATGGIVLYIHEASDDPSKSPIELLRSTPCAFLNS